MKETSAPLEVVDFLNLRAQIIADWPMFFTSVINGGFLSNGIGLPGLLHDVASASPAGLNNTIKLMREGELAEDGGPEKEKYQALQEIALECAKIAERQGAPRPHLYEQSNRYAFLASYAELNQIGSADIFQGRARAVALLQTTADPEQRSFLAEIIDRADESIAADRYDRKKNLVLCGGILTAVLLFSVFSSSIYSLVASPIAQPQEAEVPPEHASFLNLSQLRWCQTSSKVLEVVRLKILNDSDAMKKKYMDYVAYQQARCAGAQFKTGDKKIIDDEQKGASFDNAAQILYSNWASSQ